MRNQPAEPQEHLQLNNPEVFRKLFDLHYRSLTVFAHGYVNDLDTAREIVQNLFARLWEKKDQFTIESSSKSYLYQSVKNACLNYLKNHKHQHVQYESQDLNLLSLENDVLDRMIALETQEKIFLAIEQLPERCKEIFKLSRFENKTYREISETLQVSTKTVENQIGIALKKLSTLKDLFLILILALTS